MEVISGQDSSLKNPFSSKENVAEDSEISVGKYSVPKEKCIELLRKGYTKGFEEMFLMAHELTTTSSKTVNSSKYQEKPVLPDNPQERQKRLDQLDEDGMTKRRLYSIDELGKFEKLWNGIEDAEIKKDGPRNLYFGYRDLACYFRELQNFEESIRFFKIAFDITDLGSISKDKIEAEIHLGAAFELKGDVQECLKHYENARKLSQANFLRAEEVEASKKLVEARIQIAEKLDENHQYQEAIHHYTETLKVTQESCPDDNEIINKVHFKLGLVYQHSGDLQTAIKYIDSYLQYCKELNNVTLTGEAQSAIAVCYEKLGNHQSAIDHLETFAKMASDQNDVIAQQKAYQQLGMLYNKLRNYPISLKYYEKYYNILVQNEKSIKKLNLARCELGIAYAQANMSKSIGFVTSSKDNSDSLSKLLQWKINSYEHFSNKSGVENEPDPSN